MHYVLRKPAENLQCIRLVEIAGDGRDAVLAQQRIALGGVGERINAVACGQFLHHAQRDIAATDYQQTFHILIV